MLCFSCFSSKPDRATLEAIGLGEPSGLFLPSGTLAHGAAVLSSAFDPTGLLIDGDREHWTVSEMTLGSRVSG